MQGIPVQELLDAGVHFGHLKKKWNPKMLPYIFTEHKGIHIIDLNKTNEGLVRAAAAMKAIARSGRKILFVATKKQAKDIVAEAAQSVGMPFTTERWLGGMLTNFVTIRKSVKKMQTIERTLNEGAKGLVKKERLLLERENIKLQKVLGGIAHLNRAPAALFLVDILHEHIALAEAKRLGITTFGIADTNADPTSIDFSIPGNDDASKSVAIITGYLVAAIKDGLTERQQERAANGLSEDTDEDQGSPLDTDRRERRDRDRNDRRDRGEGGDRRERRGRGPGGNNNPAGGNRRG